ncbi:MAG: hypothetical protein WEC00_11580, partial [Dongiaceae bacterium]
MATDSTNNTAPETAAAVSESLDTKATDGTVVAAAGPVIAGDAETDALQSEVNPTATQLVLAAPIPEPAPGENIFVNLAPGESFSFAFDLSAPGVYADIGNNGEIVIHVPHGGGEGTYGHVYVTGISPEEFTAATGEPVLGDDDDGIPELRDPNDQASFREFDGRYEFEDLYGGFATLLPAFLPSLLEKGPLAPTELFYEFPEPPDDEEIFIYCGPGVFLEGSNGKDIL